MRIHHIALRTRDVERLCRFYEHVFGLHRVRVQPGHSVWLDLEGSLLMVEQATDREPSVPAGSQDLLAFSVTQAGRDQVSARLAERTVRIEHETEHTTYFRDPDGRRVAVSSYPILPRVHVVGALLRREGMVLVTRRKEEGSFGGLWEFPGGKVEPGERPEDALARELREELGCACQVGGHFQRVELDYPDFHICLDVFEAELVGEPQALGVAELAWHVPAALRGLEFPPADQPVVRRLVAEAPDEGGL